MNGYMDKEGRKFRARKTRYFKLKDSALFNHRRKDALPTWGVSLIDSRVAVGHKSEVIVQLFDGKRILLFPHSRSECNKWVDLLQRASRRKIGNYYGVTGLVGMGSFAEVRIGYDKSSGQQVAIKVMKKNKRDTELMRSVECEMNFISKNIDHENIVATYDVFDTRDNLFIVMEYMPGGMLYDILANGKGYFSEKNAAEVMRDLLESVQCLHDNDIVHRDIKPENVLALHKTWPLKVKLADFGLADFVLENSFGEKSTCGMYGTPFFVAPEVIRAETYTPAVDIWSLGVLTYNMLSGKLPFDGNNIKEVLRRVRAGRYTFPGEEWDDMSDDAKDFIRGLLELDPKKRLTAREALAHPWLTSTTISERAITNDRSALGYEQRRLRMSSMAIDDVAGLLKLDDEDNDVGEDTGVRALSRLFPGKSGKSGKSSRSSGSSRSRHMSSENGKHQHHSDRHRNQSQSGSSSEHTQDNSAAVSNAAPLRLVGDEESTQSEVSNLSYPYNGPGELPVWDGVPVSVPAERRRGGRHLSTPKGMYEKAEDSGAGRRGRKDGTNYGRGASHSQHTAEGSSLPPRQGSSSVFSAEKFVGGLAYNDKFLEGAGADGDFALPAILSVKDIMRRRHAATEGVNSGNGSGSGNGNKRKVGVEGESDSDAEEDF